MKLNGVEDSNLVLGTNMLTQELWWQQRQGDTPECRNSRWDEKWYPSQWILKHTVASLTCTCRNVSNFLIGDGSLRDAGFPKGTCISRSAVILRRKFWPQDYAQPGQALSGDKEPVLELWFLSKVWTVPRVVTNQRHLSVGDICT